MIKTAIVILNWNGKKFLEKFIDPLIKNTNGQSVGIFIADNFSNDGSVEYIENNYPGINVISFDRNYGFAGGYNKALEKINAEYYILLNSDVEVTPNWIHPIINLMDYDKHIAACMPKIKSFDIREYFEYAGAAGGFIDKHGFPFCRGRIIDNIEKDVGQYDNSREIFWASGACMFIRADLFKKAGGFDPDFFAHMEEIDLCWRLKNMGYKIMYSPGSTVYHVGGGTLPNNNPHKLFLNFRNNLFLLYKNLPEEKLKRRIFLRILIDGAATLKFLFTFKFSFVMSVVKAHLSFYSNLKLISEKRKNIAQFAFPEKHAQMYNKSILWQYFISSKKVFSNLEL